MIASIGLRIGVDRIARDDPSSGSRKLGPEELRVAKPNTLADFLSFVIILLLCVIAPLGAKNLSGS